LWQKRLTEAKIWSADLVHLKGFGLLLCSSMIVVDGSRTARAGFVKQAITAVLQKSAAPLANRVFVEAEFGSHGLAWQRKKVEMRFAHMKRILRLYRFRLRGLSGIETKSCSRQPHKTLDGSPSFSVALHHPKQRVARRRHRLGRHYLHRNPKKGGSRQ
jgi:hypothetical protein